MNSVSPGGKGYIGPIVYQHPGSPFDGANTFREYGKLTRYQFRLSNLNEIDALPNPPLDVFKPRRSVPRSRAVRNQVTDHSRS